mgnify:FL=1|jgi:predicted RND superfamily exporter protein
MFAKRAALSAFIFALLALSALSVAAQTATPVPPTATPVTITFDTNELLTASNSWISTFTPIFAISIGIAVAVAILTFIGMQILKAFRSPGKN